LYLTNTFRNTVLVRLNEGPNLCEKSVIYFALQVLSAKFGY